MSVVGARPNFMKVAPIVTAIRRRNADGRAGAIDHVLVHTGQHYDAAMSDSFFADLGLPAPDVHLGVGSGSHAGQTAAIMTKFEAVLLEHRPDVMIVVGDVNSTVACALVAAKIGAQTGGWRPQIAHVEAGLRSFDRTMPEEINRIVTDHLSDVLFVTEESGAINLAHEGIPPEQVQFVGNTMIDSLMACVTRADASGVLDALGLRMGSVVRPFALLTFHRPANVDSRDAFEEILAGLADLGRTCPLIFPAHPRTRNKIAEFGLDERLSAGLRVIDPQGYIDFLALMKNARIVVTDSGGIQEETTCLGIPCVTVRENTERPVTISCGTNVLAGVRREGIRTAIDAQLSRPVSAARPRMWDGRTAERIVEALAGLMASGSNAAVGAVEAKA